MYLALLVSLLGPISATSLYHCLVSALLLLVTFPEFAGTLVTSSHHHSSSQQHHNNENSIFIQSNMSMNNNHYYYHYQTGKRTLYMDEEDPRVSTKWQWVLKPSRRTRLHHNTTVRERPVRHWWANLLRPRHQASHSKRSTSFTSVPSQLFSSSHHSGPLYECLDHQCPGLETPPVMTLHGATEWVDRVCSANQLDRRVYELLTALEYCPRHKVCQILSPEELQRLGDDNTCRQEAEQLWSRFHKIFLVNRDFSDVFQEKFDTANYSVSFNSTHCQKSYQFWTCSIFLPLYLRNPESGKVMKVESCQSVCKEVEKTCPFLIKGLEDDKAAGNPSFLCKDDLVPNVMKASVSPLPCCYKDVLDPQAGSWVSFNLDPVCQEPDQNQLDSTTETMSILPSDAEHLPDVSTSFRSAQLLCDKIPSPSDKLNITASEIGNSWYVWRQRLRDSNLLNLSLSREGLVEDPLDDSGFDLLRLVKKILDELAEIIYGSPLASLPMTTSATLPPSNYTMTDPDEQPVATSSSNRTIAFLSCTLTVRFCSLALLLVAILHWTKDLIVN